MVLIYGYNESAELNDEVTSDHDSPWQPISNVLDVTQFHTDRLSIWLINSMMKSVLLTN